LLLGELIKKITIFPHQFLPLSGGHLKVKWTQHENSDSFLTRHGRSSLRPCICLPFQVTQITNSVTTLLDNNPFFLYQIVHQKQHRVDPTITESTLKYTFLCTRQSINNRLSLSLRP
jgi:hypothetical protein